MRIIAPHVTMTSATSIALVTIEQAGWNVERCDVSADDQAYWRLLYSVWKEGLTTLIIEQDIVPTLTDVWVMDRCSGEFCAGKYPWMGGRFHLYGLGFTKFEGDLMRRLPNVMKEVGRLRMPGHTPAHWCTMDASIRKVLKDHDVRFCEDHDLVGHTSDYPSHGCLPHDWSPPPGWTSPTNRMDLPNG